MAVPTYTSSAQERQLFIKGKGDGSDVNSRTVYGYQNFVSLDDFEKERGMHVILDVQAPGATQYQSAPLGSLFVRKDADNVTLYQKVASNGNVNDWRASLMPIYGTADPGTNFTTAALGTIYIRNDAGNVKMWLKIASAGAASDWALVTAVAV
jgi:hypothetical protein